VGFNTVSFNQVGIDVAFASECLISRNNVSRSATVDCRWDGAGPHTFVDNSCGTGIPAGAWD
jgi:hypothetical protein